MQTFLLWIFAIDKALKTKHSKSDIQIALDRKLTINPLTKFPPEYHGYADIFHFPSRISFFSLEAMTIRFSLSLRRFQTIALCIGYQKIIYLFQKSIWKTTFVKDYSRQYFHYCFSSFICKKTRRKIEILRWLSKAEYHYHQILVSNPLDSGDTQPIKSNLLVLKVWYYCRLQQDAYSRRQGMVNCF